MADITATSKVSIVWLASLMAVTVTTTMYIARVESKAELATVAAQAATEGLQAGMKDTVNYLRSIDQRLSRIEGGNAWSLRGGTKRE